MRHKNWILSGWALMAMSVHGATKNPPPINLSPDNRFQTREVTLAPGDDAVFTVSIHENAQWKFHSSSAYVALDPMPPYEMPWTITGSPDGRHYTNHVLNAGWEPMQSIALVTCKWVKASAAIGEGEGRGGDAETLGGMATNIANASIVFKVVPDPSTE